MSDERLSRILFRHQNNVLSEFLIREILGEYHAGDQIQNRQHRATQESVSNGAGHRRAVHENRIDEKRILNREPVKSSLTG